VTPESVLSEYNEDFNFGSLVKHFVNLFAVISIYSNIGRYYFKPIGPKIKFSLVDQSQGYSISIEFC